MPDINQERAKAVREAWKNERAAIMKGNGTRNWTQREQIEIIRKNQAHDYDGHHMKSVKEYPNYAGDPQNIQFLKKGSEHIKGAHGGNTKNSTNGYYNPNTKTMHNFGNNKPQVLQQQLRKPISQSQIDSAIKREQYFQNRVHHDRSYANQWRQANGYSHMFKQGNLVNQTSQNKGIEMARQKEASNQLPQTSKPENQGLQSFQSKSSGQTATGTRNASSGQTSSNSQKQER